MWVRLLLLLPVALCYKALVVVPGISRSQLIFNTEVATTLARNGFEVTLLIQAAIPQAHKYVAPNGTTTIIFNADVRDEYVELQPLMQQNAFRSMDMSIGDIKKMVGFFGALTENTINNDKIMEQLRKQTFDVGFAHIYSAGAIGILEAVGVKSTIVLASGNFLDHFYWYMGVPVPPSFVPVPILPYSDHMNFVQRAKNLFGSTVVYVLNRFAILKAENDNFRAKYGDQFPTIQDLIARADLAMVNADELFDLPRPVLHKVLYIGGIGMTSPKPLDRTWTDRMKKGKKGVVLFSLGTVAKSKDMPETMRKALLNAFKRIKDYHFIVRFEGAAPEAGGADNMEVVTWLPQKDLLNHERLKLFVTHGGFNSVLESVNAAVPMVLIPLFGDQVGNGIRAERAGVGVYLDKLALTENMVYEAVMKVLEDKSYGENAHRLGRMIAQKPGHPEDRLVQYTKFLAEFKTLENLTPASAQMSFVEYFNLDILFLAHLFVFLTVFVVKKLFGMALRRCRGTTMSNDKKRQ